MLLAVAVVLAAGRLAGSLRRLLPEPDRRRRRRRGCAEHGNVPVLSNNSEDWYVLTGLPAADLPRTIEATHVRRP